MNLDHTDKEYIKKAYSAGQVFSNGRLFAFNHFDSVCTTYTTFFRAQKLHNKTFSLINAALLAFKFSLLMHSSKLRVTRQQLYNEVQ